MNNATHTALKSRQPITREAVEETAADVGRPVLDVITDLQGTATTLGLDDSLEELCAIKSQILEEREAGRS